MIRIIQHAAAAAAMAALCLVSNSVIAQTVEQFVVQVDAGYDIAGEVSFPDHIDTAVPAIILVSGSGPQDRYASLFEGAYSAHRDWTMVFNAAGFAVVTFDETGLGESGGNWADMGLTEHADNVSTLIESHRDHPRIDGSQLFVLGHSEGGLIALMLGARGVDVAGLILAASPGMPLREILEYQLRTEAAEAGETEEEQEAAYIRLRDELMPAFENAASLRDGLSVNPISFADQVVVPTLILQGDNDWQIRPHQADLLGEAIDMAIVRHFDEVNHLLVLSDRPGTSYDELDDLRVDPRVTSAAIAWIARTSAY